MTIKIIIIVGNVIVKLCSKIIVTRMSSALDTNWSVRAQS